MRKNKLLIIDSNYENKLFLPRCKVISVDKTGANGLIVDLEDRKQGEAE